MIIGDLTTDFEDAEFPELWPTFGFNPNATGPTGNTAYGLCRGPQINGTLTNMAPATDWVRTEKGWALNFSVGYVLTTFSRQLLDFTVVVWFRDNGVVNVGYERLVDKNYATGFWIGRNGLANSWGGGVREESSPYGRFVTLSDGNWHHIVSRRKGTTHTIIGDAASVASGTVSGLALSSDVVRIGISHSFFDQYVGHIADIRIYDRALTDAEVVRDYQLDPGGWARRKTPMWYIPSGQAFIDHTSTILRLMSGGVL